MKHVSSKTGATGSSKWLSASKEVRSVHEITIKKTRQFSNVQQNFRIYKLVMIPRANQLNLAKHFIDTIRSLPEKYDEREYLNVIKKYGTHYLTEVLLGGRAESRTIVNTTFVRERGSIITKNEARVEYSWLKQNKKEDRHQRRDHESYIVNSDIDTLMIGGKPGNYEIKDWAKWSETLALSPTVVSYKVGSICDLITWNKNKVENLNKVIMKYLEENQPK